MWFIISILLLLYTFSCLVLIFVILIQSGKGGGLSSLGSASQGLSDALGATGAEKTLNKVTTWCAVGFMVLALAISIVATHLPKSTTRSLVGSAANQTTGAPTQNPVGGNPGAQPAAPTAGAPAPVQNHAAPAQGPGAPVKATVPPPAAAQPAQPGTAAPQPAAPAPAGKKK